jgi:hypothetical protein
MHRPKSRAFASLAPALLVCLAAAAGSARATAAADLAARYDVATTGIAIGHADLSLVSRAPELTARFTFENGSLLGLVEPSLTRMSSLIRVQGRQATPQRYQGLFRKEDRDREITMTYAEGGGIGSFQLAKRGRVRVDAVPSGLPPEAIDPLAALVRLRAWLERAMAGDVTDLSVFDGRKVYETSVRYLGPVQMTQYGETLAAHHVAVRYRQVAQLDEDEGVLRQETDRERALDTLLSADGRYLPLRVSGSFDGLPLTAELDAACLTPPGCPVGE